MKKLISVLIALQLWSVVLLAQSTTIYVVRHAEKVTTDPKNTNPTLTEAGLKRAKILAKQFRKTPLTAVYSTNFDRNKLTAKNTAASQKLDVTIYDPKGLSSFTAQLLQQHKGQHILVVGHSNTVLETIEALGGKRPVDKINDDEYSYLFVVTVNADDTTAVVTKHYGKKP